MDREELYKGTKLSRFRFLNEYEITSWKNLGEDTKIGRGSSKDQEEEIDNSMKTE